MSHFYGRNPVACTRCRRLKVKCKADSHNLPCQKCIRDGGDCVYVSVGEETGDTSRTNQRSDVYNALSRPDPRYSASGPYGSCTNCTNYRRVVSHPHSTFTNGVGSRDFASQCDGHRPCTQCFTSGQICDPTPVAAHASYPSSSAYPYQSSSNAYPNANSSSSYSSSHPYPNTHYSSSNSYPPTHSSASPASYSSAYTSGQPYPSPSSTPYPYTLSSNSTAYYPHSNYMSKGSGY